MAVTLQRSLLPRGLPEQSALDVAYRYLPAQAGGRAATGSTCIPLPGARVALVVGDVVGHGLHAAATMGRLRTAVHNFSTLDLPPDELLGHLDELVGRIDQDEAAADSRRRRASPGPPACTRSTTRSPGSAPWPAPGIRRPRWSSPTAPSTSPTCPPARRWASGGLPFETAELRAGRGQPAGPLHRRARRGPGPGHRRRASSCCARALAGRRPVAGGHLPGRARRPAARPARATTSRCSSPAPARWTPTGSPTGRCRPTRRPSAEVRAAVDPAAGRVGAGRAWRSPPS